jgi:hypothetical protein
MGFYYGPGNTRGGGPEDDKPGGIRETLAIIWVVFRTLALPVGVLVGVVIGLILLFYLFTLTPYLGIAAIVLIVLAILARGIWEARHPPEIR